MKRLAVTIVLSLAFSTIISSAEEYSFMVEENEIDASEFAQDLKRYYQEIQTNSGIASFDVANDGSFVLGFYDGSINCYDAKGEFISGFQWNPEYKTTAIVQFYNNDLFLYATNSRGAMIFSMDGYVIQAWRVSSKQANAEGINQIARDSLREINGYVYEKKSYPARFIKVENGKEIILYQAEGIMPMDTLIHLATVFGGIICVLGYILWQELLLKKRNKAK